MADLRLYVGIAEVPVARTPLFDSLARLVRLTALADGEGKDLPPLDELIELASSRRSFLKVSALATVGTLVGGVPDVSSSSPPRPVPRPAASTARIAIVGAGIAGLNAAYRLQQAGLRATLFEGSGRTGGRIYTEPDLLGTGLTTELGGEFIDTPHREMFALMKDLGLRRLDTEDPKRVGNLRKETYFFGGQHHTTLEAARELKSLRVRICEDFSLLKSVNFRNPLLDRMSLAEYLDSIGAGGWLRQLLEVAYVTEYGLDAGEQSAINFLSLFGDGLKDSQQFRLLGPSNERYKVLGGNQQIVDRLARRVASQIRMGHRLEAIRPRGKGYSLTFQTDGGAKDEPADLVVLAIPFTMLRDVNMTGVQLPPVKARAIRELGYGTNAKVLVGFKSKPWQKQGYTGSIYSDEPFQLAWANSFMQHSVAGGLTLFLGGRAGVESGKGTVDEVVDRLMPGIERAYPGARAELNGKKGRFHWPSFAWTKGSYACYKPGQWTTIAGSEGEAVDNLFFAGEHCSSEFQGFMNGAAQSGRDVAEAIRDYVGALASPHAKQVSR